MEKRQCSVEQCTTRIITSSTTIQRQNPSPTDLRQRTERRRADLQHYQLQDCIPWNPNSAPPYSSRDWWTPDIRNTIVEIFHIHEIKEGKLRGIKYIVLSSEELEPVYEGQLQIGTTELQRICIAIKSEHQVVIGFNSINPVHWPQTPWLAGKRPMQALTFDSAEWE